MQRIAVGGDLIVAVDGNKVASPSTSTSC